MIVGRISTIDDLLRFVGRLKEKHTGRLWYRGEEDASLELIPSIQRSDKRMEVERFITNDFYTEAHRMLESPPAKKNYAAWVSLMQHYGLPTRLLDWTTAPLIAAFFAVETYETTDDKDAGIWILVPDRFNDTQGFGHCIYPIDAETTQEMLLPAFKHNHHNHELDGRILACSSIENDRRMNSQQANFTVHNGTARLEKICDEDTLYKMVIPGDRKKYFIDSLNSLGITEKTVYPDLDHLSIDLRRQYGI